MTFFVSSKRRNDSESESMVDSQRNTFEGGSLSEASTEQWENRFRDGEDETMSRSSSSDNDVRASERFCDKSKSKARSMAKCRATIVEDPELSFESIDSSYWPRSRSGEYNRRRWCKVMVILTLMVALSVVLGVLVSNRNKATTNKTSALETESIESPPPSNNIFDEEDMNNSTAVDEDDMNNSTAVDEEELFNNSTETGDDSAQELEEGCVDMLRTDQRCYTRKDLRNDELTIGFVRCEPHRENWVGIYQADLNAASLPEPLLWLWTCDEQNILDCNEMGSVSGALAVNGMLEFGFYQAHLVERNGNAPYSAFLSSDVFQVSQDCSM